LEPTRWPRYTVRLIGIDSPEFRPKECGSSLATENARRLAPQGRRVLLKTDPTQPMFDRYDRLLAYVRLPSGRQLNRAQVAAGWAKVRMVGRRFQQYSEYKRYARRAKRQGRGAWGICGGCTSRAKASAATVGRYWIANAGTSEDPLPAAGYRAGAHWREKWGDVVMFARRPSIERGDRLVYHAVGSANQFKTGRLFSVVEVISDPEPSGHDRWPWQVKHRMLVPGPRVPSWPSIDDIDVVRGPASYRQPTDLRACV
jgi:Staphylococcal nuclease homologue